MHSISTLARSWYTDVFVSFEPTIMPFKVPAHINAWIIQYIQGRTKQFAVVKKLNFLFMNIFSVWNFFTGKCYNWNYLIYIKISYWNNVNDTCPLPKTYIIHYAILVLGRIAVTINDHLTSTIHRIDKIFKYTYV